MASNRKKQDDKHLKILRNLASLPGNKECFDCSQRGPTYVNSTIGTFVCTKCSGMLRGLTPPHRVKSISMASFTPEEIETIRSRGNDYCRKVWLALYDPKNEQDIKSRENGQDFMVEKYEKRRYYMEPSPTLKNGNGTNNTSSSSSSSVNSHNGSNGIGVGDSWQTGRVEAAFATPNPHPYPQPLQQPSLPPPVRPPPVKAPSMSITATTNMFTPDRTETFKFPAVGSAGALTDPFGLPVAHSSTPSSMSQPSFANFDDNPIFAFSPQPSLPVSTSFPSALSLRPAAGRPPTEDKYAALKDLDSQMKQQLESHAPSSDDWPEPSTSPRNPFAALNGNGIGKHGNVNGTGNGNGVSAGLGTSPSNPFRGGFDLNGPPTHAAPAPAPAPSPWATHFPSSHSMPFPTNWPTANDLTVGPSKSNPFL